MLPYLPSHNLRTRILICLQFEQALRIFPPNLQSIAGIHLRIVEPGAAILKRLERVIDREQNSVGAHFGFYEVQSVG